MDAAGPPIHFIDFEGNGVSGILEYGVVTILGGSIVGTRTRLCRAAGPVSAAESAIHGLSAEDVAAERPFSEEWELFAGLRCSGPLAAHFAGAEHSLLRRTWPYPRQAPDFVRGTGVGNDWGPWIDTGRLYPQLFPAIEETKLERLVASCAVQSEVDAHAGRHCPPGRRHYHAALYDAIAGATLLMALLKNESLQGATIPWLLRMSTLDPERRDLMQQGELF